MSERGIYVLYICLHKTHIVDCMHSDCFGEIQPGVATPSKLLHFLTLPGYFHSTAMVFDPECTERSSIYEPLKKAKLRIDPIDRNGAIVHTLQKISNSITSQGFLAKLIVTNFHTLTRSSTHQNVHIVEQKSKARGEVVIAN